jgi:hypothetical protein
MPAAKIFLKKARDYDMIGVGRPMGLTKKSFEIVD